MAILAPHVPSGFGAETVLRGFGGNIEAPMSTPTQHHYNPMRQVLFFPSEHATLDTEIQRKAACTHTILAAEEPTMAGLTTWTSWPIRPSR